MLQNQDHYAVLGLAHVRYKATQKQIKAARKFDFVCVFAFQNLCRIPVKSL